MRWIVIFKNAVFYKITGEFPVKIDAYKDIAERLKIDLNLPSRELGCDYVFTPKLGSSAYYSNGCVFMNFVFVEKKIPAKLFAKLVEKQIYVKEKEFNRNLSKNEISEIKDMYISQLKSKAIATIKEILVCFDLQESLFIADCSYNVAEKIIAVLRRELGTFKVEKAFDSESVSRIIRTWCSGSNLPKDVSLGYKVKLKSEDEIGATASFANDSILQDEIQTHLVSKKVKSLEIIQDNILSCTIKDDGSISGLRFLSDFKSVGEQEDSDISTLIDAEFLVLRNSLLKIYKQLI